MPLIICYTSRPLIFPLCCIVPLSIRKRSGPLKQLFLLPPFIQLCLSNRSLLMKGLLIMYACVSSAEDKASNFLSMAVTVTPLTARAIPRVKLCKLAKLLRRAITLIRPALSMLCNLTPPLMQGPFIMMWSVLGRCKHYSIMSLPLPIEERCRLIFAAHRKGCLTRFLLRCLWRMFR